MKNWIKIAMTVLALGAFTLPAHADKGGVPNANASDKAKGNTHGGGGNGNNGYGNGGGDGSPNGKDDTDR